MADAYPDLAWCVDVCVGVMVTGVCSDLVGCVAVCAGWGQADADAVPEEVLQSRKVGL
jgi:hypothetical protein